MSKAAFAWGFVFGLAIAVILLGHNGILTDCAPVAHPVSPRQVYTPDGCAIDFPQKALVCHYRDIQGNHIITTHY